MAILRSFPGGLRKGILKKDPREKQKAGRGQSQDIRAWEIQKTSKGDSETLVLYFELKRNKKKEVVVSLRTRE